MNCLFQNQTKTVSIFLQDNYLLYKMSGDIGVKEYKEGFNRLLAELEAHQFDSVLFDYSDLKSDPAMGRAWFVGNFVPKANKILTNNSHFAIAQASSMFQRMVLQVIVKACREMGLRFKLQYFDKLEEAKKWIETGVGLPAE